MRTSPTAEVAVCLRSQVIDDDDGGVGGGRRARGLRENDGGVSGGQEIDNESKGSETTVEAEGARQRA